jgi:hypothetical protein
MDAACLLSQLGGSVDAACLRALWLATGKPRTELLNELIEGADPLPCSVLCTATLSLLRSDGSSTAVEGMHANAGAMLMRRSDALASAAPTCGSSISSDDHQALSDAIAYCCTDSGGVASFSVWGRTTLSSCQEAIGTTTTYDTDAGELRALLAQWRFAERVVMHAAALEKGQVVSEGSQEGEEEGEEEEGGGSSSSESESESGGGHPVLSFCRCALRCSLAVLLQHNPDPTVLAHAQRMILPAIKGKYQPST